MDWNLFEAGRGIQRIKSRSLMQLVSRKIPVLKKATLNVQGLK
jgi:hypothetical protein